MTNPNNNLAMRRRAGLSNALNIFCCKRFPRFSFIFSLFQPAAQLLTQKRLGIVTIHQMSVDNQIFCTSADLSAFSFGSFLSVWCQLGRLRKPLNTPHAKILHLLTYLCKCEIYATLKKYNLKVAQSTPP